MFVFLICVVRKPSDFFCMHPDFFSTFDAECTRIKKDFFPFFGLFYLLRVKQESDRCDNPPGGKVWVASWSLLSLFTTKETMRACHEECLLTISSDNDKSWLDEIDRIREEGSLYNHCESSSLLDSSKVISLKHLYVEDSAVVEATTESKLFACPAAVETFPGFLGDNSLQKAL